MSEIIRFQYHPNAYEQDVFEKGPATCQCCGKQTEVYYPRMYCRKSIHSICPACIANGAAAEKFQGDFIQDAETEKVSDPAKTEELFKRTPGYTSWQGEYWLACCNDYCEYLGEVGTVELEELGIADEVFAEYEGHGGYENVREYLVKSGSCAGYLFRCRHCGAYRLWVDCD